MSITPEDQGPRPDQDAEPPTPTGEPPDQQQLEASSEPASDPDLDLTEEP